MTHMNWAGVAVLLLGCVITATGGWVVGGAGVFIGAVCAGTDWTKLW